MAFSGPVKIFDECMRGKGRAFNFYVRNIWNLIHFNKTELVKVPTDIHFAGNDRFWVSIASLSRKGTLLRHITLWTWNKFKFFFSRVLSLVKWGWTQATMKDSNFGKKIS